MSQTEPIPHPSQPEGASASRPDPARSLLGPRPGILFVLSGPSGVGKDAVISRLKSEAYPLHYTVTFTTRAIRPGEQDGASYHFVSRERFQEMQERGELLEWALVHGNQYGTPVRQVREAIEAGKDVLLKIDVQGAAQVKRRVPEAVFIFLAPPSIEELIHRLKHRSTESEAEMATRIANAYEEMARLCEYDYVVVNNAGGLDEAVRCIQAIILAEGCRVQPRQVKL